MTYLFAASLAKDPVPADQLQEVVRSYQTRLFTGLLEIGDVGGGYLDFLFCNGEIVSLCARNPGGVISIAPANWQKVIPSKSHHQHTPGILTFPPHTVQLARIYLTQADDGQSFTHQSVESLVKHLELCSGQPELALLHIRWEKTDGLVFLGKKQDANGFVLFADGQELPDKVSLADLASWPESNSVLTILNSKTNDAWEVYMLQFAFSSLAENLLQRYGEVTGRVMVNSVVRALNVEAASNGWDINVIGAKVFDQAVFVNSGMARTAYKDLLIHLIKRIETLVGRNITTLIVKDVLAELDDKDLNAMGVSQLASDIAMPLVLGRS